jgi:putative heme-binding domain-containing protein
LIQTKVRRLLEPNHPLDLQLATLDALVTATDPGVGPLFLSGWNGYSPKLQTAVLDALFKHQNRIQALLTAIADETIPRPGFDPLRRQQLLANPDDEIRRLAERILDRAAAGDDRQQLLSRYQVALSGPRDPARGRELFQINCSSCHVLEGVGIATGPELIAATKGRADETILLDILQPSDQITVGYRTYNIVTVEGYNLSGTLSAETATSVTLPDEDGFPMDILRKDIVSMQASDVSLMPANFETLLKPEDISDLLGYLRQLASAGPGPVLTLFEDDPTFPALLTEGDGTAEVRSDDAYAGTGALRITPLQRFSASISGWGYSIVQNPGPGEYRYLRFAWKAPQAEGVMLELAANGEWPRADEAGRRFYAGENSTGWRGRQLADGPPSEWTVITVDLWDVTGEFRLTGIAPTAMGGAALFDSIQLLATRDGQPPDSRADRKETL